MEHKLMDFREREEGKLKREQQWMDVRGRIERKSKWRYEREW